MAELASKFKRQCKLDNRQTSALSPRRILIFGGGLPLQNFDGRSCEKVTAEGEAISCSQRHGGAHESAEDAAQAIPQMPIVTKKGCPQLEVQISKIKTVHHRDASARQPVSWSPSRCHERGPDRATARVRRTRKHTTARVDMEGWPTICRCHASHSANSVSSASQRHTPPALFPSPGSDRRGHAGGSVVQKNKIPCDAFFQATHQAPGAFRPFRRTMLRPAAIRAVARSTASRVSCLRTRQSPCVISGALRL